MRRRRLRVTIERAPSADVNSVMVRVRVTGSVARRGRNMARIGAAILCMLATPVPAQQRSQPFDNFQPTMNDVAPGIDHGNADDNLPEQFQRQAVFYRSQHPVGTVIIDTAERHLYLIESETRALRYGIGVGRDGFTWAGLLRITRKAEWPDWVPPPEMIVRQPYLPRFMAGGPGNPLGSRAMYLGNTIYRIHGTNAPETIGQALSSGCFRLVNDDAIDLYDRVSIGTHVIVRQN
jgi:lipoprotein-anchoring transpeptidase ErfK/SrfK